MINQHSLAVIIDCWENNPEYTQDQQDRYKKVCRQIRNKIESDASIKSVAIFTAGENDNQIRLENPFYNNSLDLFVNTTRWDTLRKSWSSIEPANDKWATHNIIKNINLREDQIAFNVHKDLDILYYCNSINKYIKNIYFFGQVWDICVKHRSVGWMQINALNLHSLFREKQNLLTDTKCVFDLTTDLITPSLDTWSCVHDTVYQVNNTESY